MGVLTKPQLAKVSRHISENGTTVMWSKPQVHAAVQAIEDWFEANRSSLNTEINAATAPLVFTAEQKKKLIVGFLIQKAEREL